MKFRIFLILIFTITGTGCISTPPAADSSEQGKFVGNVISVTEIPNSSNSTEQGREWMGSMYGAVGILMNDLLSTKKGGNPIYVITPLEGPEVKVESPEIFAIGECVVVHFSKNSVERPDVGLHNASISKSTDCVPIAKTLDGQGIQQLQKSGANITQSQNIEFLFYFPTIEAANRVANALSLHGFVTKVQPTEKDNHFSVIAQKSFIPTESTLAGFRLLFNDMAMTEHGQFDRWQLAETQ